MHLFLPWKMADALVAGTVGKNEYRVYLALFVITYAYVLSTFVTGWNPDTVYEPSFLLFADIALFWGITLSSLGLTYWLNKKGDGQDYWRRYICLDISISVFLLLITLVAMVIAYLTGILNLDTYGYTDFALAALFNLVWLALILKYFKKISTAGAAHVSSPV